MYPSLVLQSANAIMYAVYLWDCLHFDVNEYTVHNSVILASYMQQPRFTQLLEPLQL